MPLTKQKPTGPLPPYTRLGDAADWVGKALRWGEAADLPIAYLQPGIEEMDPDATGAEIYYVGSQANNQFMPVRRPNILMVDTDDDAALLLADAEFVAAADRLGIVLCRATAGGAVDGTPGTEAGQGRVGLRGFPLKPNPDGDEFSSVIVPTEQYVGGRLLILLNSETDLLNYDESETVPNYDYIAQMGSDAFCSSANAAYTAGTATSPDLTSNHGVEDLPVTIDYNILETFQDVIDADKAYLTAAKERFDRLKVVMRRTEFVTNTYEIPVAVTCFDTIAGANTIVFPSPDTITGTAEPSSTQINNRMTDLLDEFIAGTDGVVEATEDAWTVAQIIAFFEED